ncbi:MAG: class I SAM-dependent methyltransferase [Candidatus Uhrbacteria bacterium]
MDLTQQTYNRIAEDWHRANSSSDWWIGGTDYFASLFSRAAEILDVGCAGGRKAKYLLDKGLQVTGIDFSEGMLSVAKREVPEADFFLLDVRQAEDLHKVFDGIFAQAVFLHVPKIETPELIKKLTKILKPGGYFYVAVKGIKPNRSEEEIKIDNDIGYEYQRFFSYYRPEEIRKYFVEAGLEIVWVDVKKTGHCEWIQMIGKK